MRPRSHQRNTAIQRQINAAVGAGGSRVNQTRRASTINGRGAGSAFALGLSQWDSGANAWVWRAS